MTVQATVLRPTDEAEVAACVVEAVAAGSSLDILGGGTRSGLGRPQCGTNALSLAGMSGITLYEPAELVIGARAGTTLTEIEDVLASRGQMLPFEPMDHRAIYGSQGMPTIGGGVAANVSGPRRLSAGAARDHLLGVTFVNGRGQRIKNGGRVMKNVTGLDLVKLSAGAMGTLGVLTEVILKVLPKPEGASTLSFEGLDVARATALMSRAMGSSFDVSAAAHVPNDRTASSRTHLRVEGFLPSIRYRLSALAEALAGFGTGSVCGPEESVALWRSIRDLEPLERSGDAEIWRLSVAPSKASELVLLLTAREGVRYLLDWAGGLIWMAAPPDAGFELDLRAAVARSGGHATLIRASPERRRTVAVHQPLAEPLMVLTRGIKTSFDPHRVLNPGRMYENI